MKRKAFLLVIVLLVLSYFAYDIYKEFNNYSYRSMYKLCLDVDFIKTDQNADLCSKLNKNYELYKHPSEDVNTYMFLFLNMTICGNCLILATVLIYGMLHEVQSIINANYLKNVLTRINYKTFLKKLLFKAYKYAFIFPLIILFLYLIAYYYSGHFDPTFILTHQNAATYDAVYLKMGVFFGLFLMVMSFVYACFYANLGLICAYKSKNIIITVVSSVLLYLGINVFVELIVLGCAKVFNITNVSLWKYNCLDIFCFDGVDPLWVILKALVYFIVSLIVVLVIYRKKEKTVIGWEK